MSPKIHQSGNFGYWNFANLESLTISIVQLYTAISFLCCMITFLTKCSVSLSLMSSPIHVCMLSFYCILEYKITQILKVSQCRRGPMDSLWRYGPTLRPSASLEAFFTDDLFIGRGSLEVTSSHLSTRGLMEVHSNSHQMIAKFFYIYPVSQEVAPEAVCIRRRLPS